ncbi:MAG: hypothetical protein ACREMY_34560 [bacterium]
MTKPKRTVASRRVAWPEPGRSNGGEFRITWSRLITIIGVLVSAIVAVPTFWTISDHWMNRGEIEKALKTHADHDAGVQQWNQYGFASNRVEYLDDKAAECDAKRLVKSRLDPVDAATCARYEAKLKTKTDEANELRAKAMEATKER